MGIVSLIVMFHVGRLSLTVRIGWKPEKNGVAVGSTSSMGTQGYLMHRVVSESTLGKNQAPMNFTQKLIL